MTLRIGTDGASLNNPGPAGWAWVDEHGAYAAGSWSKQTNNVAELTAIHYALADHLDVDLVIESDSQYSINCVTTWGPGWRANPKKAAGKKNLDLVYGILDLLEERTARGVTVDFVWVRGHDATNAHPLNTAADHLSSEYAARRTDLVHETGTHEIDWDPRGATDPANPLRQRTFATQTVIGKKLGLTARQVGQRLVEVGFKQGAEPTPAAHEAGICQPRRTRDGASFHVWDVDAVTAALTAS